MVRSVASFAVIPHPEGAREAGVSKDGGVTAQDEGDASRTIGSPALPYVSAYGTRPGNDALGGVKAGVLFQSVAPVGADRRDQVTKVDALFARNADALECQL